MFWLLLVSNIYFKFPFILYLSNHTLILILFIIFLCHTTLIQDFHCSLPCQSIPRTTLRGREPILKNPAVGSAPCLAWNLVRGPSPRGSISRSLVFFDLWWMNDGTSTFLNCRSCKDSFNCRRRPGSWKLSTTRVRSVLIVSILWTRVQNGTRTSQSMLGLPILPHQQSVWMVLRSWGWWGWSELPSRLAPRTVHIVQRGRKLTEQDIIRSKWWEQRGWILKKRECKTQ